MDREFTIPGDFSPGESIDVASVAAVPDLWDLKQYGLEEIWAMGITGKGVRVAVNDTGCDENHPDIPKAVARRSFVGGDTGDRNTHGTWCSARAVGRNGVGIAPEAELIVAKVLSDGGSGSTGGINAARIWAASEGADIISESLGGPQGNQADIDSIEAAYEDGVQLDVAAAGNAGYNGSNTIGFPGRYLQTWCVGSHKKDGSISGFSSGGREIDCATPGENVISARSGGGYLTNNGTSMACPFWAGVVALILQKFRHAGFPDIYGADPWRERLGQLDFWDDAGEPGKDVRFGLGKPRIQKIFTWLKEPNWFVWFCLMFCLPSMATAQELQKSTITHVKSFQADAATVTAIDGGVSVMVEGMRDDIVPAVIVTTDAINPLVRAYKSDKPFPPKTLNKIGGGRYLLDGPAGSKWTIEILAQTESNWWTEYLEATIGDGTDPNPPPVDPPAGDWTAIQTWVAGHATPGLDKDRANTWSAGLESAASVMDNKTLEAAQALSWSARREAFTGRVTTDWNPFFTELTAKINAAPPTDTPSFKQLTLAIAKGLKR